MSEIIVAEQVDKTYGSKEQRVQVLKKLHFIANRGDRIVVTGESGAGKTTFLSVISGLDNIDAGKIIVSNIEISNSTETFRAKFRLEHIGFIFQYHYLLKDFSALGNVMIPLLMLGRAKTQAKELAHYMLQKVGLEDRLSHLPSEMSGGECQRTAIARALVHRPSLVLADEPTGALDNKNSEKLRELLCSLAEEHNTTLIMATHDREFLSIANSHWHIEDGTMQKLS